ncbi:flagellar protein FlgN [Lutispora thermophila]|uniref:FlgN protein n=1 Tax=Lutispora thermophila DSM 19022 TaxID=1122184 RepID=A0A1M6AQ27_9FIRM|nr:flagellar protein FlgN [Lutispora thermophila]SHI38555.1 FlgN protein [Lutispora thermophila DSM 19022]
MDNIDKIILSLEKENNVYKELLSISKKKKDVIIDNKIDELDSIIKMEGNLVLEISKLEDEREKAVDELAKELGCDGKELSISYLCSKLEDRRVVDLKKIADNIGKTLSELKEINDLNGKLIEQSLEYVNFSINLVADIMEEQGSFRGNSLFDAKV